MSCNNNQVSDYDCTCGSNLLIGGQNACSNGKIIPICPYESLNNFDCWCLDKVLPAHSGVCNIHN